jgi:putative phosphoesterase
MNTRIGIIGDIHAEDIHLDLALAFLSEQAVDVIICTGDIVDGNGDVDRCCELLIGSDVRTVRGNHDRWLLQGKARDVPNAHTVDELDKATIAYLESLPTQIILETIGGRLLLCHGVADNDLQKVWPGTDRMPVERSTALDEIIASGQYRCMVNGHVHYRTLIQFKKLTLLNAGTLRGDHHPGFSILDFATNSLEGFEFGPHPHLVRRLQLNHASHRIFANTHAFDGAWQPVTLYA